jgi:hypothetical protein
MVLLHLISYVQTLAKCPSGSLRKATPEYLAPGASLKGPGGTGSIFYFTSFLSFRGGVP